MRPVMALAVTVAALLAPATALAQTHGAPVGHPEPDEAELLAATARAHANLTEIMHAHVAGDYSAPDYPFIMSYVDKEETQLVVMMHVMAALAGIQYEEEELHVALGVENPDVGIEIIYGTFTPDASWVRVESWRQYYLTNCVPEPPPDRRGACAIYAEKLRDSGVGVPGQDPGARGPAAAITRVVDTGPPAIPAQAREAQPAAHTAAETKLRGGMALEGWLPAQQSGERSRVAGTTGIAVDYGGAPAMVVSSHVIDAIGEGAEPPVRLTLRGPGGSVRVDSEILATTDILSVTAVSSDAAVVRLNGTNVALAAGEIQSGASTIGVSAYGGVRGLLGQDAGIVGAMARDGGPIMADTVSIREHVAGHDRVMTKQAIAAYSAARGDSGAPIVHTDAGGRHTLLGIHLGTIRAFNVGDGGQLFPRSLGGHGGDGTYGVFSTWENVKRDLDIP